MEYRKNSKAYLIENNVRITEVTIVQRDGDKYLVRFPSGGGIRIGNKRLYPSQEEAEKNLPYKNAIEKEVKRTDSRQMNFREDESFHSPHYFGWI